MLSEQLVQTEAQSSQLHQAPSNRMEFFTQKKYSVMPETIFNQATLFLKVSM